MKLSYCHFRSKEILLLNGAVLNLVILIEFKISQFAVDREAINCCQLKGQQSAADLQTGLLQLVDRRGYCSAEGSLQLISRRAAEPPDRV